MIPKHETPLFIEGDEYDSGRLGAFTDTVHFNDPGKEAIAERASQFSSPPWQRKIFCQTACRLRMYARWAALLAWGPRHSGFVS